jgi:hypothetical protein
MSSTFRETVSWIAGRWRSPRVVAWTAALAELRGLFDRARVFIEVI